MLLALIPYVASIIMYAMASGEIFRAGGTETPTNWNWRFVAPVTVAGLTPLSLAARHGVSSGDRSLLLSEPAIAIIYTIIAMSSLRDSDRFHSLQKPIGTATIKFSRLLRWRLVWFMGALIVMYGAVINVIVAGN